MSKFGRNRTEIRVALRAISEKHANPPGEPTSKMDAMADALEYGYTTARTCWALETRLLWHPDLEEVVAELAEAWDGESYISGALRTANRQYEHALERPAESGAVQLTLA